MIGSRLGSGQAVVSSKKTKRRRIAPSALVCCGGNAPQKSRKPRFEITRRVSASQAWGAAVPAAGVEPARAYAQKLAKPLRLPIPPRRHRAVADHDRARRPERSIPQVLPSRGRNTNAINRRRANRNVADGVEATHRWAALIWAMVKLRHCRGDHRSRRYQLLPDRVDLEIQAFECVGTQQAQVIRLGKHDQVRRLRAGYP